MFNKDRFIQDCVGAIAGGHEAIRELVAEAVSDRAGMLAELGEPQHAGLTPIFRSPNLTIINFVWAPCMSLMPHNHHAKPASAAIGAPLSTRRHEHSPIAQR